MSEVLLTNFHPESHHVMSKDIVSRKDPAVGGAKAP